MGFRGSLLHMGRGSGCGAGQVSGSGKPEGKAPCPPRSPSRLDVEVDLLERGPGKRDW